MIEKITAYIQPIIEHYGAWGVFLTTLIEEIVAPIPSPLVPLTAGFFLLPKGEAVAFVSGQALFVIALPVAVGIVIGSLAVYGIGYWGGKPMIEKNKRWLGLDWKDVEKMEQKIIDGKGDEITLFMLRVLPIIPGVAISGFCGIVRYPLRVFVVVTFLGAFVRAVILGVFGWYVGVVYLEYITIISNIEKYVLAGALLFALLFLARFALKRRHKRKDAVDA